MKRLTELEAAKQQLSDALERHHRTRVEELELERRTQAARLEDSAAECERFRRKHAEIEAERNEYQRKSEALEEELLDVQARLDNLLGTLATATADAKRRRRPRQELKTLQEETDPMTEP